MNAPRRSFRKFAQLAKAAVAATIVLSIVCPVKAQTAEPDRSYIAVVVDDQTHVRVGSAPSFYCIAKLKAGQMVKVIDEDKYRYSPIALTGPTFKRCFGYIRQPHGEAALLRISPDQKTGVALGRVEVVGAFLDERTDEFVPGPDYSWKKLALVPVEKSIQILETIELEGETVYRVAMPDNGRAWINSTRLRRATPEETNAWNASVKKDAPKTGDNPAAQPGQRPLVESPRTAQRSEPEQTGAGGAPTDTGMQDTETAQPALAQTEQDVPPVTEPAAAGPDTATAAQPSQPEESAEGAASTGDREESGSQAAAPQGEPEPEPAPETSAAEEAQEALKNLEAIFEQLRQEPVETAEVDPLKALYQELADNQEAPEAIRHRAGQRARQLDVWSSIQRRKIELARAQARSEVTTEQAEAVRLAILHAREYAAVGRLDASTIYDGRRLPLLFRLQDPGTGRTIAYVQPSEDFELVTMLGQLVGIAGDIVYDGGLRLNLIKPRQIDALTPR